MARTRALAESAARMALPTPEAPGICDLARIESRWRSVSVSRADAPRPPEPPQAASKTREARSERVMPLILATQPASHEHPIRDEIDDQDQRSQHRLTRPA